MNKTYSPAFKARLVQELLKATKTIAQLAAEHGIHPNLLGTWKATALHSLPTLFERRDSLQVVQAAHECQGRVEMGSFGILVILRPRSGSQQSYICRWLTNRISVWGNTAGGVAQCQNSLLVS